MDAGQMSPISGLVLIVKATHAISEAALHRNGL